MREEALRLTAKEIRDKYQVILEPIPVADPQTKEKFEAVSLYVERLQHIYQKKRRGDMKLIGEMLGISADYADKSFNRLSSKHHIDVVDALEEIIASRDALLGKRNLKAAK
jgi:hypothetical protein